jgi:putative ABC transport system permease protein
MRSMRAFLRRFQGLWRREASDSEFAAELESHLQMRTEEKLRLGMTPAEARRAALLESGGIAQATDAYRDRRGLPLLESLWQDLRYGFRTLRKQPVFSMVAVLTLMLGIGANTAIFSLVYRVLLQPLPYAHSDRLVFVWNAYRKGGGEASGVAIPDYLDRRAGAPAIEDAALFTPREVALFAAQQPEAAVALAVTPSFFSTLGRGPAIGRAFTDADAVAGRDRVAILTHALWESQFAADPSVLGRDVRIDGEAYTIAGVLPADFELPSPKVSVLVPFTFSAMQKSDQERGNEFSQMIARLRPGATIAQLDTQMQAIVNRLMQTVPARADYMRNSGFTGIAIGMRQQMVGDVKLWLWLLQGGVGIVVLIACANVANLLLMRATGRRRELAVRAALGAGARRLTQQLLVEGAALSLCGAAGGVVLAVFGVRALQAMTADQFPDMQAVVIQPAVLLFTATVAMLTSAVFGLAPALQLIRARQLNGLREDSARSSAGKRTGFIRAALVIAETALAVVLLVAAGLLLKGFARLQKVDPGFSPSHVLTAQISLPRARYGSPDSQRAFWSRVIDKLRSEPGVTAAGLISSLPLSGRLSSASYQVVGRPLDPGEKPPHARQDMVAGDYFGAMRIPLLQGRTFNESDGPQTPRVAVIDEFLAKRQFPDRDALGRQLNFGSPRNYTIIGVVATVNDSNLALPVPEGRIYLSGVQIPLQNMGIAVRAAQESPTIAPALRAAVRAVDAEQPLGDVRSMTQWVEHSLSGRRTPMTLLTLFGAVALVLSAIGMYGVLAFSVSQRVRELGIRQALGADRSSILTLVLAQGLWTVSMGLIVGLAAAAIGVRYLQSMLFAVQPHDAGVFAAVTALLLCTAAVACYIPARRATRVDPIVALREG